MSFYPILLCFLEVLFLKVLFSGESHLGTISWGIPSRKVGAYAVLAATAHWLASNEKPVGSRWNIDSAWHAAAVQLLKISLVVNWNQAVVGGMHCKV